MTDVANGGPACQLFDLTVDLLAADATGLTEHVDRQVRVVDVLLYDMGEAQQQLVVLRQLGVVAGSSEHVHISIVEFHSETLFIGQRRHPMGP